MPSALRLAVAAALLFTLTACDAGADPSDDERPPASARPAPDPKAQVRPGVILQPPSASAEDCAAINALLAAVDNTPSGATIRIAAYTFTHWEVVHALVAAHDRGVHVQVMLDAKFARGRDTDEALEDALGTDRRADSFLVRIRGTARGDGPDGFTHQKTWMFTRTGTTRWVTFVGSANLDYACQDEYNDVFAFVGRRDVFDAFSDLYRTQIRDRAVADPARFVDLGSERLWFYPGYDVDDDPVRRLLASLPAAPDTTVRVAMLSMLGDRASLLGEELERLARGGASARIVVRHIGDGLRDRLRAAGVELRSGQLGEEYVHHKLALVSWTGADGRRQRVISTGSDNWTGKSLERDEVLVQIDVDDAVRRRSWDDYQAHHRTLFTRAGR